MECRTAGLRRSNTWTNTQVRFIRTARIRGINTPSFTRTPGKCQRRLALHRQLTLARWSAHWLGASLPGALLPLSVRHNSKTRAQTSKLPRLRATEHGTEYDKEVCLLFLPAVDCGPVSKNKHPVTGGYQSYRNVGSELVGPMCAGDASAHAS